MRQYYRDKNGKFTFRKLRVLGNGAKRSSYSLGASRVQGKRRKLRTRVDKTFKAEKG